MRGQKINEQAVACYFRYGGYFFSSACFKVLKASTGAICYPRDVTWAHSSPLLVTPPPPAGGGVDFVHCCPYVIRVARYVIYASVCNTAVCCMGPYRTDATASTTFFLDLRRNSRCWPTLSLPSPRLECRQYRNKLSGHLGITVWGACRGGRETRAGLFARKRVCNRFSRDRL